LSTRTQIFCRALVGSVLLAWATTQASPLPQVTLRYGGESKSGVVFVLENGSSQAFNFHGVKESGQGINPWDGSIECRFTKTSSESEILLLGHKEGDPEIIRVSPGDRTQLSFRGYEAMFFAKHRRYFCVLHLEAEGHEVVDSNEFVP
jgi:hypothetical protein